MFYAPYTRSDFVRTFRQQNPRIFSDGCWLKLVLPTHGRTKLSEFPIDNHAVTYTTYDETRKGRFRTKRGTLWAPFANLVLVKVW